MRKRIVSLILSLLLLGSFASPVMAEETEVSQQRYVRIINLKNLEKLVGTN